MSLVVSATVDDGLSKSMQYEPVGGKVSEFVQDSECNVAIWLLDGWSSGQSWKTTFSKFLKLMADADKRKEE